MTEVGLGATSELVPPVTVTRVVGSEGAVPVEEAATVSDSVEDEVTSVSVVSTGGTELVVAEEDSVLVSSSSVFTGRPAGGTSVSVVLVETEVSSVTLAEVLASTEFVPAEAFELASASELVGAVASELSLEETALPELVDSGISELWVAVSTEESVELAATASSVTLPLSVSTSVLNDTVTVTGMVRVLVLVLVLVTSSDDVEVSTLPVDE